MTYPADVEDLKAKLADKDKQVDVLKSENNALRAKLDKMGEEGDKLREQLNGERAWRRPNRYVVGLYHPAQGLGQLSTETTESVLAYTADDALAQAKLAHPGANVTSVSPDAAYAAGRSASHMVTSGIRVRMLEDATQKIARKLGFSGFNLEAVIDQIDRLQHTVQTITTSESLIADALDQAAIEKHDVLVERVKAAVATVRAAKAKAQCLKDALVETCKAIGVDPEASLQDILGTASELKARSNGYDAYKNKLAQILDEAGVPPDRGASELGRVKEAVAGTKELHEYNSKLADVVRMAVYVFGLDYSAVFNSGGVPLREVADAHNAMVGVLRRFASEVGVDVPVDAREVSKALPAISQRVLTMLSAAKATTTQPASERKAPGLTKEYVEQQANPYSEKSEHRDRRVLKVVAAMLGLSEPLTPDSVAQALLNRKGSL